MSFDGLFTHAMVTELQGLLVGGRIAKIHQPYPQEVILVIRNNGKNYPLLLSAHPTFARAQITNIPYANPTTPPSFAMMLRKHLEGAKIEKIEQVENDRIIKLSVLTHDELGDLEEVVLILEMMGRHSNLFLVNQKTNKIIELIKHVSADQNRVRSLYPGAQYIAPPKQDVINPYDSLQGLANFILDIPDQKDLAKAIQGHFQGFAFDSALELATVVHEPGDAMAHAQNWLANFSTPAPQLIDLATNNKVVFAPFKWLTLPGTVREFATLGEMLDIYFADRAERDRVQQQAGNVIRVVRNEIKKNKTKLKKLEKTLDESAHADEFKVKGELLTTYLYQVERGMTEITLPNYYDNEKPMKIPLSNQIGPSQNAQKYFTKYNKLKKAVAYVDEQIALTQHELEYLENIMAQIEIASPKDINEIRMELTTEGYIRNKAKNKKARLQISQPEKFYATDGTLIEVGKNNLQNDKLSLKTAARNDIWLHVQKMAGSHVIIHDSNPSEQTLLEGATLAAYFSKARESANVPVDYLPAKLLRKPNGSKPGYVIFEGQSTMYVTPDAQLIDQLRNNKAQ
ncbi:NFACT RNA binding domain-containing protein [Periweissella fabalis]|uniref:Rqc2 homolog RqcH n=1 Tax=Periweissella fabalis TaxID=1070421 RepID=A0A7X6N494_9LACO|nr:NFACT RNA binding domain-containing protein [Periweissella fabalis]MCM0599311.1 NFACT family protein [Periweissella fabalis]NKZ23590.1 fibronectin/fibrinogen-binding protein [Periweissella fabalis]